MIVNGPIQGTGATQGQGDVIFGTGISAGGCGTVVLNSVCNYAGVTAMKQFTHGNYGTAGPTSGDPEVGIVQLGINNALPQTTDLSFGAGIGTQTDSAGYSGAPRPARVQPDGQVDLNLDRLDLQLPCRRDELRPLDGHAEHADHQ